jgi:homeobox protein cut-like
VAHSDLEHRLADLQSQLNSTLNELDSQRTLNAKLEEDLLRMNNHATAYAGSVVASTRYTFRAPTHRPASPTSSIIGHREDIFPKPGGPETGILPIITQQRDRFRARNSELEEDLRKQLTVISSLRGEIQSLQKDNLGLYEKVRYFQQFTKNASGNGDVNSLEEGTSGASGSARPGVGFERYRSAYEESMTPFEVFRGKESARVYRSLNPLEKILYSLTRAILANRYSRNAFFVYCIGLHLLVMCLLYWLVTTGVRPVEVRLMVASRTACGDRSCGAEYEVI